jgi:hypothetical protein
MKFEGYIPFDMECERALIHFPPMAEKPVFIPTPDLRIEVASMLLHHTTKFFDRDTPF